MTRVLVVGGGVAGTATAMALRKVGLEATVYEARPDGGADEGAFLTVGANGMLALAQIEAAAPVAEAGFALHSLEVIDAEGIPLGVRPLRPYSPRVPGYHHLRRSELYRVLQGEAERRGVEIRRSKRLVTVERHDGGVRAFFDDGTSTVADLLVGADGLGSRVRTLIDPVAPAPRYVGARVFYGYAPDAAPAGETGTLFIARGSDRVFGYTVSPQGHTWWFARLRGPELDRACIASTPASAWRTDLEAGFRGDATAAADIVAATGDDLFATNARDIPSLPIWHRDGMVVLGDAAHAASPASGQGASMALEDAVMLAKALRDVPGHGRALTLFEQLRRPRTEANVAASAALDSDRPATRGTAGPPPPIERWLDWDTPIAM